MKIIPDPMEDLEKIQPLLPEFIDCSGAAVIGKGFSFERKYLVSGTGGESYIARISDVESEADIIKKKEEFDVIRRLRNYSSIVPGYNGKLIQFS